ncbi:MAG: hypothetical protein JXB50_06500 [Spirochaetes bacterium]|nr:hypothetical protein [Spirochaetota bacterium]
MKYYFILFLSIFILLFSCVSSPDVEFEKAAKNRQIIEKYQLQQYAEEEYRQAEESYKEAKEAMDKNNNFKAGKAVSSANQKYQVVLDKGFPPYTEKKDNEVQADKKATEEIKGNVALKNEYDDALKSYNEGILLKKEKKYEQAIEKFQVSKEKFQNVYKVTKEKKEKNEGSLESTDKALKEVQDKTIELNIELEKSNM